MVLFDIRTVIHGNSMIRITFQILKRFVHRRLFNSDFPPLLDNPNLTDNLPPVIRSLRKYLEAPK